MTTTHMETEVKLEADEGYVLPDLSGLQGVASIDANRVEDLDATYFDTSNLSLLGSRTTLRRRIGGTDEGWHLKLPAGGEARREVHHPLGRAAKAAPVELTSLVRSSTMGSNVAPVAHLATRRTVLVLRDSAGRALAEVADDTVSTQAYAVRAGDAAVVDAWREIEVELIEGDRVLLKAAVKALTRRGARPARNTSKLARALAQRTTAHAGDNTANIGEAGAAAVTYIAGQVAELRLRDPQVRLDVEDAVHLMRVATRRLRSALATFRPLFGRDAIEPLRVELQWLGTVLGHARDAEVLRDRLLAAVDALPAETVIGPVRDRIDTTLTTRYRTGQATAVAELDGSRYLSLLRALDTLVAEPPADKPFAQRADKQLPRLVQHAADRVQKAARHVESADSPATRQEALHEVRKTAKRARYAAESVEHTLGKRATRLASAMKDITQSLGLHQDSVIARRTLLELAADAHTAQEPTFTYGVLHVHQSEDGDQNQAGLPAARRATRKLS